MAASSTLYYLGLAPDSLAPDTRHWVIVKPMPIKRSAWGLALPREIRQQLEHKGLYPENIQYGMELLDNGDLILHLQPRPTPWAVTRESEI